MESIYIFACICTDYGKLRKLMLVTSGVRNRRLKMGIVGRLFLYVLNLGNVLYDLKVKIKLKLSIHQNLMW